MKVLFLEYPKCTTCKSAKKWLDENGISYEDRHIVEDNPTKEELTKWIRQSERPIKSFFNTSGNVYKDLKLKDKLADMEEEEQIALLSTNGMLVKRPLIVSEKIILTGFKPEAWQALK